MKKWIILVAVISGCNGGVVEKLLKKESPYENYLDHLESSPLGKYALVKDWKAVGERVMNDSVEITLPYQEVGYFEPKEPEAMLLRYRVEEGHQVDVELSPVSQKDAQFFMDVFEIEAGGLDIKRIHSADSSGNISYRVKESGTHALRIQPELFRGGVFTLSLTFQGLLSFPIQGKSTLNIASYWGDPRDGDARKHEGIDIFSPRGTPVVAASPGRVRRVGNNRLGGRVVWLANRELGHSQYYAHLDTQMVESGQQINKGDTLGLVGNTGNAITTSPHLHFGIYKSGRGAVDPFPFLQDLEVANEPNVSDTMQIGTLALISSTVANLRAAPSTTSAILGNYKKNTLFQIEGKTGTWYRISMPDGKVGYLYENLAQQVDNHIQEVELNPLDEVRENWLGDQPVSGNIISGKALVLGQFEDSFLVETSSGFTGWWRMK